MGHTFVIAEHGVAHDGDLARALKGVEIAKDAGADAYKTQFWSSAAALSERRRDKNEKLYKKYQLKPVWIEKIKAKCGEVGLDFLCTVYLEQDIAFISNYVSMFKVASPETLDNDFIAAHRKYGKWVILSSGKWDWNMHRNDAFFKACAGQRIAMLHCISKYPAKLEEAELGKIRDLGFDGWSDHTKHRLAGAFAVMAGARYIEVHFQGEDTDPANPDGVVAHKPDDLREYCSNVRLAEKALPWTTTKKGSPESPSPQPSRQP